VDSLFHQKNHTSVFGISILITPLFFSGLHHISNLKYRVVLKGCALTHRFEFRGVR